MDLKGIPLMVTLVLTLGVGLSAQQRDSCIGQLDLVFMVDASNSVLSQNFDSQMRSLAMLTSRLTVQPNAIRIGVVVFSSTTEFSVISGDKNGVISSLSKFDYLDEATRTDLGLQQALQLFRNANRGPEVPKLLMIITDGASSEPVKTRVAVEQLKAEGISIYAVGISNAISEMELQTLASSPSQVLLTPDFTNISKVLEDAVYQACTLVAPTTPAPTTPPPVFSHLCSSSGSMNGDVGYVNHPTDCDKYVQCYYNPVSRFHMGVVRTCPLGLHWDGASRMCNDPEKVKCVNDPCKSNCGPYPAEGTSRGYWQCEDGVSRGKCCGHFQSFVPGKGCVNNTMCMEPCRVADCGKGAMCKDRPNWSFPAMFDKALTGGRRGYFPATCDYNHYDIVSCKCTAPIDHICNPDFETNFQTSSSLGQYVTANNLFYDGFGVQVGNGRSFSINLHKAMRNEPLTLQLEYREDFSAGQDRQILLQSNSDCKMKTAKLVIGYNNQEIVAGVSNGDHRNPQMAKVAVPTLGFNTNDFKEVTFGYDDKYIMLRVKVRGVQFVSKTKAPRGLSFPCGLDVGPTTTHTGFSGRIQKLSIFSCSLKKLY